MRRQPRVLLAGLVGEQDLDEVVALAETLDGPRRLPPSADWV
jgi:hypothetical protein